MAGLAHPVIGPQPQPAHALGHRRTAGANDDAQAGQRRAQALEVGPRLRAEDRQIDDHGVEPHGHDSVERHRAREDPVLPAHAFEPAREHAYEAGVGVDDGEANR
jgi:hypothetical protein